MVSALDRSIHVGVGLDGRWESQLSNHLAATIRLLGRVAEECGPSIATSVRAISQALNTGGKLMVCGNGGSAADSQHVAAELTNRLTSDYIRPGLAALALTTDTSFLTAYANDYGFEGIFERQVQALGRPGDVLLGISTSGGSENVRRAVRAARNGGMTTIAILGEGGPLKCEVDHAIVIPSRVVAHVQEAMLAIEHVLCHGVEREVFPN